MTGHGLRERAQQERMARICTAADALFEEKGYERVTTREIAERAGVGEATLFRYFPRKSALLLTVVGDRVTACVDRIVERDARAPRGDGRSYVDRIYAVYDERARFYAQDPVNVAAFTLVGFDDASDLAPVSISQGDRVIALVASVVEEGRSAGALRRDADAEAVALNCNAAYVHEITRSPVRRFAPGTFGERLRRRLAAQLELLLPAPAADPAPGPTPRKETRP